MTDPISTVAGSTWATPLSTSTPVRQDGITGTLAGSPTADGMSDQPLEASASPERTDRQELEAATKVVEEHLGNLSTNLQFSVDRETRIMTLKVVDSSTQKVIREYPAEEVLKMAKFIKERLESKDTGLLVDIQH